MPSKVVRIGFVGCGGIAQAHMDALSKIEGVQLVAFCDIVPEKAKAAAKKHGGKAFTKVKQMLKSVEVDALFFCLPPFAHGDELLAIEHGIPFFVEKPVGLDLGLIREIAACVREKNLLTSVGYMNRYRRSVTLSGNFCRKTIQSFCSVVGLEELQFPLEGFGIGGFKRTKAAVSSTSKSLTLSIWLVILQAKSLKSMPTNLKGSTGWRQNITPLRMRWW
jgi:Predicted dehydrogenases and related proteins